VKSNRLPDHLQPLVPMTPAVFYVLFSLADGEKHGYAIMQETSKLSNGDFRMGPGTLYTTLQRLLDLKVIEEVEHATAGYQRDSRRRYYCITGTGRALLEAELARLDVAVRLAKRKKLVPRPAE
jgi:DNA-binding PadR family transcriptional regulator